MKISSRIITIDRTPVFMGDNALSFVDRVIRSMHLGRDGIYILVDKNTRHHCLPVLLERSISLAGARLLEIDGGEDSKSLATAEKLWNELLSSHAGRDSLLVNLGGGVVTDLGGFIAAGFKRGIRYLNIPTSLIGMTDAAIGGKVAVNLGMVKNQLGFFHAASSVIIYSGFLKTLPPVQLRSGMAEIIKSVLVGNVRLWHRLYNRPVTELLAMPLEHSFWQELLNFTITYKNRVVVKDYREQNYRRVLNFGHTVGHALEAFSHMDSRQPLLHGEAVAAGMVCAAYLSHRKTGLSTTDLDAVTAYISNGFPINPIDKENKPAIFSIMMHDKKQKNRNLLFTLISKPGLPKINISCEQEEVSDALDYLNSTLTG